MYYQPIEQDNKELKRKVCARKKYPIDYPQNLRDAMETITDDKSPYILFGSSIFRNILFAGDIDIRQQMDMDKQRVDKILQTIIRRIMKRGYLIGDIKAGLNPRYAPFLDYLGMIKGCKIVGYSPAQIMDLARAEGIKNLMNIPSIYDITIPTWLKIYDIVHSIVTVRWDKEEILKGSKRINDDIDLIKLQDAVKFSELNKIDMYAFINGKFLEITNVFDQNPPRKVPEIVSDIKLNMLKYLMTDINYSKALKRAYSAARLEGRGDQLSKIVPYLTSNINLGSSCVTDLSVIEDILEHGNKLKNIKDEMMSHLNFVISKLSNFYKANVDKEIKYIYDAIDNIDNQDIFLELINKAKKGLKEIINNLAHEYINNMGLNLARDFCP